MSIRRFIGFEAGNTSEAGGFIGGSIVSTGQRTGDYAYRSNATEDQFEYFIIYQISGTGTLVSNSWSDITNIVGFAFKAASLPASSEVAIVEIVGVASGVKATLVLTSTGILKLYDGSLSANVLVATGSNALQTGQYYYIEFKLGTGTAADYEVRINGVAEFSGTVNVGATEATANVNMGKINATAGTDACDLYFDDIYVEASPDATISFRATTTAFPEVRALRPNGAGASSGWTNGTGTTFAEVDEVPPESDGTDATYIQASATQDNTIHTLAMQNAATASVTGTIIAVVAYVWARTTSTSGTSNVRVRLNGSVSAAESGAAEMTTTYGARMYQTEDDPGAGGGWALSAIDSVEVGMTANTIAQVQRFSAAYAFVLALVTAAGAAAVPQRTLLGVGT